MFSGLMFFSIFWDMEKDTLKDVLLFPFNFVYECCGFMFFVFLFIISSILSYKTIEKKWMKLNNIYIYIYHIVIFFISYFFYLIPV